MNLICIDPGTKTGYATSWGVSGVVDLSPAAPRKGKPGRPAKLSKRDGRELRPAIHPVPPVPGEPDDERLVKLWKLLNRLHAAPGWPDNLVVVHEGPLKHHAGVRAAQLAFWWQAAIALWCRERRRRRVEVPPIDLQRYILGRATTPGSNDMLEAAQARGFRGVDHNEADAWLLLEWARAFVTASSPPRRPA